MRVWRRWGNWPWVEARDHRFRVERDKASCSKACSYVVRRDRGVECLDKRVEEVLLRDVGDLHPHHLLNLLAVRDLERAEAPNIERLEEVGRMGRHAECNNVVGLAKILKVYRVMAVVAVEDKQSMYPSCTAPGRLVKMFYPVETNLVGSPAILACVDSPFGLEPAVLVPGEEVVFSLDGEVRRHDPAVRTHSLDHPNPLSIARLLCTRPATAIGACHDLCTRKDAHLEPGLVEVVDIRILDRVLSITLRTSRNHAFTKSGSSHWVLW